MSGNIEGEIKLERKQGNPRAKEGVVRGGSEGPKGST